MSEQLDRSSSENVTIEVDNCRPPTATVSSLKSEDSTEQLICKTPLKEKKSVSTKSVEPKSDAGRRRLVVLLGLGQVVVGALLVGGGALAVVKGAALSRVGAGLWAGCVAVVAGVVGVLAGINDCYGLNGTANSSSSPLLTAFLALSLLCLACGNSAAVLAATGLQRDTLRAPPDVTSFQDEMEAWTPVLTNIAVLIIASIHCLLCIISIYHVSKRVCPCFRPKQAFDHNQFDPGFKAIQPYVVVEENKNGFKTVKQYVDEKREETWHELCKDLEVKLQGERRKSLKKEEPEHGSANSKEKLVTHWLGRQQGLPAGSVGRQQGLPAGSVGRQQGLPAGSVGRQQGLPACLAGRQHNTLPVGSVVAAQTAAGLKRRGVRKQRKPQPVMLVPAHPASTPKAEAYAEEIENEYGTRIDHSLGRMPVGVMLPAPRYATLPPQPPQYAPVFYPVHDTRIRRRRSPREPRGERRGRRREHAKRDTQLTRSLERIHRKRRSDRDRLSDAELKRTYTGLDRTYAEQYIAVCDESRHAATEQHDSLASTSATSDTSHTHSS